MKRVITAIGLGLLLAGAAFGCKKGGGADQAKMDACKTDPKAIETGDGCEACCKAAGASGHGWMAGFGESANSCECM